MLKAKQHHSCFFIKQKTHQSYNTQLFQCDKDNKYNTYSLTVKKIDTNRFTNQLVLLYYLRFLGFI